jgi:hypothetical protein
MYFFLNLSNEFFSLGYKIKRKIKEGDKNEHQGENVIIHQYSFLLHGIHETIFRSLRTLRKNSTPRKRRHSLLPYEPFYHLVLKVRLPT